MNKTLRIILLIFIFILAAAAGIFGYKYIKERKENARQKNYSECINIVTGDYSTEEKENLLVERFKDMPAEDCTDIIDVYIYGTYNYANNVDASLTEAEADALTSAITGDDNIDIEKITDESIKTHFKELREEHVVPRYVNESLFMDCDYKYFSDTFGKYLLPDYKEMLDFFEEEKNKSYCKASESMLYTDVVENRLDKLYEIISKYPESMVMPVIQDSYRFYKSVYLGAYDQNYIFNNGSILKYVYDAYSQYEPVDEELNEFLKTVLKSYKDNDLIRTIDTFEKIKKFCEPEEETQKVDDSENIKEAK